MSERYTRLYVLPENLYLERAPVLIAAGALLKDNKTERILAQLKLRNLYHSPLTACKVHIRAFEPGGGELKSGEDYSYLDIHVDCGMDFGSQKPVYLPDNTTRRILVSVIQAVFEDGTVWRHPVAEWKQPPLRWQRIEERLSNYEMRKQYAIEAGGSCEYLPEKADGLFLCTCGTINLESERTCSKCHREMETLMAALDDSVLASKVKERLAMEEAERIEKKRIAEEKRKEEERKRKEEQDRIAAAAVQKWILRTGLRHGGTKTGEAKKDRTQCCCDNFCNCNRCVRENSYHS